MFSRRVLATAISVAAAATVVASCNLERCALFRASRQIHARAAIGRRETAGLEARWSAAAQELQINSARLQFHSTGDAKRVERIVRIRMPSDSRCSSLRQLHAASPRRECLGRTLLGPRDLLLWHVLLRAWLPRCVVRRAHERHAPRLCSPLALLC